MWNKDAWDANDGEKYTQRKKEFMYAQVAIFLILTDFLYSSSFCKFEDVCLGSNLCSKFMFVLCVWFRFFSNCCVIGVEFPIQVKMWVWWLLVYLLVVKVLLTACYIVNRLGFMLGCMFMNVVWCRGAKVVSIVLCHFSETALLYFYCMLNLSYCEHVTPCYTCYYFTAVVTYFTSLSFLNFKSGMALIVVLMDFLLFF